MASANETNYVSTACGPARPFSQQHQEPPQRNFLGNAVLTGTLGTTHTISTERVLGFGADIPNRRVECCLQRTNMPEWPISSATYRLFVITLAGVAVGMVLSTAFRWFIP